MADLSTRKPSSATFELMEPDGSGTTGITFDVISVNDDKVKAARQAIENKGNKLRLRNKWFTADEIEANTIGILAATIVGWTWGKDHNGEPALWKKAAPDFSPRNVADVLSLAWVRQQLDEFLNDETRFFQK